MNKFKIEHEILGCLYRLSIITSANGSNSKGYIPLYERSYHHCTLHFGTLVDMLNSPQNYTNEKIPEGQLLYFQNKITRLEDIVGMSKYNLEQIADAIEVLKLNEHVTEYYQTVYSDIKSRIIVLSKKGAIDFRNGFYLKLSESDEIEGIKNSIIRIEENLKTHWLRNEIIKYTATTIVGTLLGAIIAMLSAHFANN